MTRHRINRLNRGMNAPRMLFGVFVVTLSFGARLQAVDLPPELPLWEKGSADHAIRHDVKEQVRSATPAPGSPSGLNRAFSSVSSATYSIHLKYRTRPAQIGSKDAWQNYQSAVQADGRQAIRILGKQVDDLGLQPNKIGICGFSAGGHLAISCALYAEPKLADAEVSGMPDFAGLFYPGIPDDISQVIESRTRTDSAGPALCPFFIVNARDDQLTPASKCVDFYASLLRAGVNAELHVFSKGAHGFGLGTGRGKSAAIWPSSFAAWLRDSNMIQD